MTCIAATSPVFTLATEELRPDGGNIASRTALEGHLKGLGSRHFTLERFGYQIAAFSLPPSMSRSPEEMQMGDRGLRLFDVVSKYVAEMLTPGSTAPVRSATTPEMRPVVWAKGL